ncbi:MAG: 4-hydroxy-tetrahydrodipicolinate reductase [Spirochaetales bacterium]
MHVLIMGYGKMGHEIEAVLQERGHHIVARIDEKPGLGDGTQPTDRQLSETEVVIEFSQPHAVVSNARLYAEAKVPAVVGTTGWKASEEEVKRIVLNAGTAYLRASNFSIGAHLFFALAEEAARMIQSLPQYDILLYEIHHNQKKDSPSGTALSAAERILQALPRKKRIVTERLDRQIEPDELHVASVRGGTIPGVHTVLLDSAADTIEITHSARNRRGFALGAVLAAEWIRGKKGFLGVEDFIKDLFLDRR